MRKYRALLSEIQRVQAEITWHMPYRDIGLVPSPGASRSAIQRAERRIGRPLPPSYQQFLAESDGWVRFFEGASLLGTANLGKRTYHDLARAACEAAETPVPDVGPPYRLSPTSRTLIPFGIDLQATTLFAFNPAVMRADGEYEVIAWINEIGLRRDSFEDFLALVLELYQAELPVGAELGRKSA
jgi:hypothetical protein